MRKTCGIGLFYRNYRLPLEETLCLGVRKTCGIGLFYRNHRILLEETICLGAGFFSVCLETLLSGSKNVVSISWNASVVSWTQHPHTSLGVTSWGRTMQIMTVVMYFDVTHKFHGIQSRCEEEPLKYETLPYHKRTSVEKRAIFGNWRKEPLHGGSGT